MNEIGVPPPGPAWSEIAGWYDELLVRDSGPHETALACLLRLTPDVTGLSILDVACGQGLASRALAGAGAACVAGIDASPAMIDLARHRTGPAAPITYRVDDAQTLHSCPDSHFDGAACQLALMDIPDLGATLAAVCRALKPGGWFVIGHPCFLAPDATTVTDDQGRLGRHVHEYLQDRFWRSPSPAGVRRVGNYHRTLATYLNTLVRAGLTLERAEEPHPEPLLARQQPVCTSLPIFFAARARTRS